MAFRPDAPKPGLWLSFLDGLLYPEDIPTLQEFIGYCLIPSNKGQRMMVIKGSGGEGKSQIGAVLSALFGNNMKDGSIGKISENRFARADLEHVLLCVDDDMRMEALRQTNYVKSIVTAQGKMDLERKGRQSYQGWMFARLLAFSNGDLQALFDRSDGFYRRQLVLTTRERPAGRVDDPDLAEKMEAEVEGIFLWAFEGLRRLGHTVNFKTYKQSYKSKKTCYNPEEKWLVFENTHEAIIDADTWERVQELRKNKRRPTRTGKTNMFSGIVRCADCGEKLYYCTSRSFEARQDHFVCSTSRLKGKEVCPTHFIRAVVLEQGVLAHMRMTIACVANHEEQFRKAMGAKQKAEAKRELAVKRRQLTQAERRIEELDRLFKRIYEDNANGKLSDSRFQMLSDDYEQEQEELREKLLLLNEEITQQEEQTGKIDRFIGKVQKYLDLDELTPAILNDMVKAVYVHAPDKSKGYREQQIDISYDLVGILPAALLNDLQNGETA